MTPRGACGACAWSCRFNNDPAQVLGVLIDESEHDQASQQLLVARDRAREEARLKSDYLDMLHAELTPPLQGLVRKLGQLRRERHIEDAELSLLQGRLDSVAQLLDALTEREEVVRAPLEENDFSPTETLGALLEDMQQRHHDVGYPFEWQLGAMPEALRGDVRRLAQLFEHLAEGCVRHESASHQSLRLELQQGCELPTCRDAAFSAEGQMTRAQRTRALAVAVCGSSCGGMSGSISVINRPRALSWRGA